MALRFIAQRVSSVFPVKRCHHPHSSLHTNSTLYKAEDRRQMKASLPAKDEGTIGERTTDIDSIINKYSSTFIMCT